MTERGNPLWTVTNQVTIKQCWARWTWTSEFLDFHILLWSKVRIFVFVNWLRRSRTTQIDTGLQHDLQQQHKAYNPFSTTFKENDSGHGQRWAVRIDCTRRTIKSSGTHRLLHMRASLKNNGQSRFHWIYIGCSSNSRIRDQEGRIAWPQIRESSRKQRIISGP